MMKMCSFSLVLLALAATPALAQAPLIDHWWTPEDCLAATSAPLYKPSVLKRQALRGSEKVEGHPTGGCFEISLPKDEGGRGWVRIEAGRPFVFDESTGKVLRLAECNNAVYGMIPFLAGDKPTQKVPDQPIRDAVMRVTGDIQHHFDPLVVKHEGVVTLQEPASDTTSHHRAWYDWHRKTGKAVVIGSALAIVGGALMMRQETIVIIH